MSERSALELFLAMEFIEFFLLGMVFRSSLSLR
jgi:hypothetical protein